MGMIRYVVVVYEKIHHFAIVNIPFCLLLFRDYFHHSCRCYIVGHWYSMLVCLIQASILMNLQSGRILREELLWLKYFWKFVRKTSFKWFQMSMWNSFHQRRKHIYHWRGISFWASYVKYQGKTLQQLSSKKVGIGHQFSWSLQFSVCNKQYGRTFSEDNGLEVIDTMDCPFYFHYLYQKLNFGIQRTYG